MSDFSTPFRERYESSRALDCEKQIRECADYIQHPDVLVHEFLESYYLIERVTDPAVQEALDSQESDELVLERFHDSLELEIHSNGEEPERIVCAGGAFDPVPSEEHPAIRQRGLDYIGVRGDLSRIVLGVTETSKEASAYLLLLRALNCFAEVSPPFQLNRLRKLVLRERVVPDATFDLQMALSRRPDSPDGTALRQLARDLAEAFKTRILEEPQFAGTLGWIESLYLESDAAELQTLRRDWRL